MSSCCQTFNKRYICWFNKRFLQHVKFHNFQVPQNSYFACILFNICTRICPTEQAHTTVGVKHESNAVWRSTPQAQAMKTLWNFSCQKPSFHQWSTRTPLWPLDTNNIKEPWQCTARKRGQHFLVSFVSEHFLCLRVAIDSSSFKQKKTIFLWPLWYFTCTLISESPQKNSKDSYLQANDTRKGNSKDLHTLWADNHTHTREKRSNPLPTGEYCGK